MSELSSEGGGTRSKDTPAEFPSDWHYHRHLDDLERSLAGAHNRLEELRAMDAETAGLEQEKEAEIKAIRDELAHYGRGQKSAAKRPKSQAKKETR